MNVHQSDCPKTVPERLAVSEFFGDAIAEIIGILTVRGAPKGAISQENLQEKQVPATRPRDAPRPEKEPGTSALKRVNGGMTMSRFNDAAINVPGEAGFWSVRS